uniref:Uncharacterized protein n=1 Tax=Manihot esculenta TaxID=3983 RepID=A0A2C9W4X5_MANES
MPWKYLDQHLVTLQLQSRRRARTHYDIIRKGKKIKH